MFAITTGDIDGIGFEVTAKALVARKKLRRAHSERFLVFSHRNSEKKYRTLLQKTFGKNYSTSTSLQEALQSKVTISELISDESPARWIETAASLALDKQIQGLITAPLSKTEIHAAGLQDMGHTGILQRICQIEKVYMGFLGRYFNVVLASGHVPLRDVSRCLDRNTLLGAYQAANQLARLISKTKKAPRIGVLGLNPHAGESGMIGHEDREIQSVLQVKQLLVPDAAFSREVWKNYDCYLALYHDQGLIPFKMIHGKSQGAQVSLGLPIVRTSVDHGTAKDIFGKSKADHGSMSDAISSCILIAQKNVRKNGGS